MKIPEIILKELEACHFRYEIKQGTRHRKIIIGGVFAGIIPLCGGNSASRRAELNIRSQIRRTVKQLKAA